MFCGLVLVSFGFLVFPSFFLLERPTEEPVRASIFLVGGATGEAVRVSAGPDWLLCGSCQYGKIIFSYWNDPQRSQSEPALALTGSSVVPPKKKNEGKTKKTKRNQNKPTQHRENH